MTKQIASGVVHELPEDLRGALVADKSVLERWEDLTPLARNEWICWTVTTKKPETRANHIQRTVTELLEGKRRPCCWPGCPHRRPNAEKWFSKGALEAAKNQIESAD